MVQSSKSPDAKPEDSRFQKVAECLYRRRSLGIYYALVKRSGKQYRRSLRTTDRKLAERYLADFRRKVERLDHGKIRTDATFADIGQRWLASVAPQMKASSAQRRDTSLRQISPYFGAVSVRNITSSLCERWAADRSPAIAASTYNNERDTILAVLNYAKREGLIIDNPAEVLRRRKLGKQPILIPSKEEFEKLVSALHAAGGRARDAANLVEVLAYSGMRLAEATSFRWADVDFAHQRFVVTGGEQGTKNHEARIVPLFPAFQQFLKRMRDQRPGAGSDLVIGILSAKTAMKYACARAGLPDFTHHCMRHYFVSNAIEAGVDFKTIAAWVGHKDGGLLVAKTYGHLRDTHSFEMAKRMIFAATGA